MFFFLFKEVPFFIFFFSSRRRHTRCGRDWSSDVCSSDLQLDLARAGGGPRYANRHHARGRLLARERIELLLDRDAHFLELSPLAAWGTEFTVGASLVT